MSETLLWFSYYDDLETELSWAIGRFEERLGRVPTILWLQDKSLETFLGGFGLVVKEDPGLGTKEFYLE